VAAEAGEPLAVVARREAVGLEAYGSRLTPTDVSRSGFEAVRVLSPSAQPLFFGDSYFGERAESVPDSMGFEPRLDRGHHPFP
jgi:ribosomal protein S12 methylthiotransferase accessory factor